MCCSRRRGRRVSRAIDACGFGLCVDSCELESANSLCVCVGGGCGLVG